MKRIYGIVMAAILCVAAASVLQGCQTLRELAALRSVDFALDRVDDAELAGVALERLRTYEDLRAIDVARLTASLAAGELPLRFDLVVAARNPEENQVQARMVRMAWTLLLDDRKTVSGYLDEPFVLPPGDVRHVPVAIELDLVNFFDENLRGLVDLALAGTGHGGQPMRLRLEALPTIETPVGPIDYPRPIVIVQRELGRGSTTS